MKSMGERILELRKAADLKQDDLARLVGVSHVTISMWEADKTAPRGKNLTKLCQVFKCSPQWLLEGKEQAVTARDKVIARVSELIRDSDPEDLEYLDDLLELFLRKRHPQKK